MADQPDTVDLPTFADRIIDALRSAGVVGNIAFDRVAKRLINEAWPEALYIEEPWHAWSRVGDPEKDAWLERYVAAFLRGREVPETWDVTEEGILPYIRPHVVHVCWPLQATLEGLKVPELPSAKLTDHLVVELAWPQADSVASIRMADLDRWNVLPARALEAAASNLRAQTGTSATWLGSEEFQGVWRSPWNDRFDAARVVFAGGFVPHLKGPPVILAPDSSCLLVADGDDEEALFNLGRATRREVEKRGSFLWLRPLRFEAGRWRHWLPDPKNGAYGALKILHAMNEKADYDRHGELLQRLFDREGTKIRVAEFMTVQDHIGNTFTAGVWDDEMPMALPVTDGVIFRKGGEAVAMAPYVRVREVMDEFLEEKPGYPPRLLAKGFPEDWQIASLRPQEG